MSNRPIQNRFRQNLSLGLKRIDLSQAALAGELGIQRSAVNKWINGTADPTDENRSEVARILSEGIKGRSVKVTVEELSGKHPFDFGESIGLSRNEIEEAIVEPSSTIVFSPDNFLVNHDDYLLTSAEGVYHSYMPSWVFKGLISCRALQVYFFKDSFYFRERHLGYQAMPETEYSGHVGRVGKNIHLIGEETSGIKASREGPRELIFASVQFDTVGSREILSGVCLGSDALSVEKLPVASPYVAVKLPSGTTIEDAVPQNPYQPPDYIADEFAVQSLKEVRQSWFTSGYDWN